MAASVHDAELRMTTAPAFLCTCGRFPIIFITLVRWRRLICHEAGLPMGTAPAPHCRSGRFQLMRITHGAGLHHSNILTLFTDRSVPPSLFVSLLLCMHLPKIVAENDVLLTTNVFPLAAPIFFHLAPRLGSRAFEKQVGIFCDDSRTMINGSWSGETQVLFGGISHGHYQSRQQQQSASEQRPIPPIPRAVRLCVEGRESWGRHVRHRDWASTNKHPPPHTHTLTLGSTISIPTHLREEQIHRR